MINHFQWLKGKLGYHYFLCLGNNLYKFYTKILSIPSSLSEKYPSRQSDNRNGAEFRSKPSASKFQVQSSPREPVWRQSEENSQIIQELKIASFLECFLQTTFPFQELLNLLILFSLPLPIKIGELNYKFLSAARLYHKLIDFLTSQSLSYTTQYI